MRVSSLNPLVISFFGNICSKLLITLVLWCIISGDGSRSFFSIGNSLIAIASASDITNDNLGLSLNDVKTKRRRFNLKGVCYAEAYSKKCRNACAHVHLHSTISTSNSSYTAGGPPIRVNISNGADIDGMMVYAVRHHNVSIKVGSWTWINNNNDIIYDECSAKDLGKNQTLVSHGKVPRNIELTWFPPSIARGNIVFRVLVVRSSPPAGYDIHEKHIKISAPPPPPTTTSTAITSTSSSVSDASSSIPLNQPTDEPCNYAYGGSIPRPLSCSAAMGKIEGKMKEVMGIWVLAILISLIGW